MDAARKAVSDEEAEDVITEAMRIVESDHILLLSNEMLYELPKVLTLASSAWPPRFAM